MNQRIRTHPAEIELKTKALLAKRELLKRQAQQSLLAFTLYTMPDFEVNWHHRVLCQVLDRFARKEIKRLMVFMPPRYGKSELVKRLAAYLLGKNPDSRIISCSYSAALASVLNRDVQRIIDSQLYREIFPRTILAGSSASETSEGTWIRNSDLFEVVGHRGFYRSAGVDGTLTGFGANAGGGLIIDDPIANQMEAQSETMRERLWQIYSSTLRTRLENDGSILIVQTRWHEDDLSGRLLALAKSDPSADQWTVVSLPAIREDMENPADPRQLGEALWPQRFPLEELEKNKASMPKMTWAALFLQRPSAMVGSNKFLVDQIRGRFDFAATLRAVRMMSEKYPKAQLKLVEGKANGDAVVSALKNEISGLVIVEPQGGKESRANAVTPDFESGNVYFPDPTLQPWVEDLMDELANFPKGRNDDQVDALSQALIRFQETRRKLDFDFVIPSLLKEPLWRD